MSKHRASLRGCCMKVYREDAPVSAKPRRKDDFELPGQRSAVAAAGAVAASPPAAAGSMPVAGSDTLGTAGGAAEDSMPEWWSPTPRLSVSRNYREQVRPFCWLRNVNLDGVRPTLGINQIYHDTCGPGDTILRTDGAVPCCGSA